MQHVPRQSLGTRPLVHRFTHQFTQIGHSQPVKLLLDRDLRRFATVWAAAGTPYSVFPVAPDELRRLTGADWSDVSE